MSTRPTVDRAVLLVAWAVAAVGWLPMLAAGIASLTSGVR